MTTQVPFVGLAPDRRAVRARRELVALDVDDMLVIGNELRALSAKAPPEEALAVALADHLNAFDHHERAACPLVQVFMARGEPASLVLLATRGVEPAWNDVGASAARVRPIDSSSDPLVCEIAKQLRLGDRSAAQARTFFVDDPAASAAIGDKSFVSAYGIERVFGLAATVRNDETVIALAFARAPVERSTARVLEILGPYLKLAWAGSPTGEPTREAALDELVRSIELRIRELGADHRRRLEQARAELESAAARAVELHDDLSKKQRRLQGAMLNVIEDLREARASLEKLVEERTHALAKANRDLESRNKELEEFVYIASHDLQEPLRTVSGYLQIIERRYGKKLGVEADEFIQFSIDGAKRMQGLLDALLHYSRVTRDDQPLERVALDAALDSALRNLAIRVEETGAAITRTPLPVVYGNPIQMVQLFQNLVGNAIKFAGPRAPKITITGEREGSVVTIRIRDEGVGFPPKFADRIFKVFRRLRRDVPGTGIGLAICKKIVERHGGRIEVESQPNVGSTFAIRDLRAFTETDS